MDWRREPREHVYTAAKYVLLDHLEQEHVCHVLDFSGAGVKFVTDKKLQPDEMVVLEIEDHLVLADVRYVEPRGDKHVVGAERTHAVKKSLLPQNCAKAKQIEFVVEDYRARIREAVAGSQGSPQSEDAGQYRDQIVTAAVQELMRQWTKEEDSIPDGTLRAAIVERKGR